MTRNNLFWCDVCSVRTIDNEGNEGKEYYSCYSAQAWIKHIKSSKHIKQIKLNESLTVEGGGVKCEHCSKIFTAESYALHEARNKSLWDCYKTTDISKMTCNNFNVGKKRYESVEQYRESKNKPKQKRVKVGSFSPVTQTTRQPNTKGGKKKEYISVSSSTDEEDTTEQDLIEIEQLKKQYYIDKQKRLEEEAKIGKAEIVKGLELTIEEIDFTERPQFDETCDDCALPINYDTPINLINKWEIDTCACEETDYSDED